MTQRIYPGLEVAFELPEASALAERVKSALPESGRPRFCGRVVSAALRPGCWWVNCDGKMLCVEDALLEPGAVTEIEIVA